MVLTQIQSFLTDVASGIGVDPVYFIFATGLGLWLVSVGATPGGLTQKIRAMIGKTRLSWVVLFLAMVITHFAIITVKAEPGVPPTKYYFIGTITAVFSGVMLKQKYDQVFDPKSY